MKLVGFKAKDRVTGEEKVVLTNSAENTDQSLEVHEIKLDKELGKLASEGGVHAAYHEAYEALTNPVSHETYFLALSAPGDAKEHDGDETEFGDYKCRIFTNKTLLERIDENPDMMVIEVTDEALSDIHFEEVVGTVANVNGKFSCMYLWTDKTLAHMRDMGVDLHGNNDCILRACLHLGVCKETVLQLITDINDKTRCLGDIFDSVAELGDKEIFEAILKQTHKVDKSKYALFVMPDAVDLKQVVQDYPSEQDFDFELNKQLNENFSKTVGEDIEGFAKQHGLAIFKPRSNDRISEFKFEWELYDPSLWEEQFYINGYEATNYLRYKGNSPYIRGRWGIWHIDRAFEDNTNLEYADLRLINLSRCRSMKMAFAGCDNLRYVNLINSTEPVNIAECNLAFANCNSLLGLTCDEFMSTAYDDGRDMAWLFANCKKLDISMLQTINTIVIEAIKKFRCETKDKALYEMNGEFYRNDNFYGVYHLMQMCTVYNGCNKQMIYDGTHANHYSQDDKDLILDTEFTDDFNLISENIKESNEIFSELDQVYVSKLGILKLWEDYEQDSKSSILTEEEAVLYGDICHSVYIPNIIPMKQLVKEYNRRKKYRDNLAKRVSRLLLAETGSSEERPGIWDEISDEVLEKYGFKSFVTADGHREIYDPKLWSCDGLDYLAYIGDDPYVVGRYNARYMDYAFAGSDFEYLDLSGLNLCMVESMHGMFQDCGNLLYTRFLSSALDELTRVRDLDYLYANCVSLLEADLELVWCSRDTSFYAICYNCQSLEVLQGATHHSEIIFGYIGMDKAVELMLERDKSLRVSKLVEYVNSLQIQDVDIERISMSISALLGCKEDVLTDVGDWSITRAFIVENEDDLRDLLNSETPYLRNAIEEAKGFLARVIEKLKSLRDAAKVAIDDAITEIDHEINVAVQAVDDGLNAVSQKVDDINIAAGQVADGFRNAAQAVKDGVNQAGSTMRGDKQ